MCWLHIRSQFTMWTRLILHCLLPTFLWCVEGLSRNNAAIKCGHHRPKQLSYCLLGTEPSPKPITVHRGLNPERGVRAFTKRGRNSNNSTKNCICRQINTSGQYVCIVSIYRRPVVWHNEKKTEPVAAHCCKLTLPVSFTLTYCGLVMPYSVRYIGHHLPRPWQWPVI